MISIAQDGIISISGLYHAAYGEVVDILIGFDNPIKGLILNISSKSVSAIILGSDSNVKPGQIVNRLNRLMTMYVGFDVLG
jgi:F0F1-type ATP synthase alpha subunit